MLFLYEGNITDPINARDYASIEAISQIHHQFNVLPSLRDVTIK